MSCYPSCFVLHLVYNRIIMKKLITIYLAALIATNCFSSTNANHIKSDNATQLTDATVKPAIYPDIDRIFFNQEYVFELRGGNSHTISRVEFADGAVTTDKTKALVSVHYANFSSLKSRFRVFVKDASGNEFILVDKEMSITQKYRYAEDEEFDDTRFFRFDNRIINISETISKEELALFKTFSMNEQMFEVNSFKMSGFDMQITKGEKTITLHSNSDALTDEMKAAIQNLSNGDVVEFSNIKSTYTEKGQQVPLNTNYTVRVTIGSAG